MGQKLDRYLQTHFQGIDPELNMIVVSSARMDYQIRAKSLGVPEDDYIIGYIEGLARRPNVEACVDLANGIQETLAEFEAASRGRL